MTSKILIVIRSIFYNFNRLNSNLRVSAGYAKRQQSRAGERSDRVAVGAAWSRRETHGAPVLAASALDQNAAAAPVC